MQVTKGVISYLKGDATQPVGSDKKIIVHICNNSSHWGKGFVLALSKRWRGPEKQFKQLKAYLLGEIQIVQVEANLEVVNMIAQNGIKKHYHPEGQRYVDYDALKTCLLKVGQYAGGKSVHMPRIGVGLGGGSWPAIEGIILETLCSRGINVFVYHL